MKATHDKHCNVAISFNTQEEKLIGPSIGGVEMQWLPCDGTCGQLMLVELNTVSVVCWQCSDEEPIINGYDELSADDKTVQS